MQTVLHTEWKPSPGESSGFFFFLANMDQSKLTDMQGSSPPASQISKAIFGLVRMNH